jgi:hypothetical protein
MQQLAGRLLVLVQLLQLAAAEVGCSRCRSLRGSTWQRCWFLRQPRQGAAAGREDDSHGAAAATSGCCYVACLLDLNCEQRRSHNFMAPAVWLPARTPAVPRFLGLRLGFGVFVGCLRGLIGLR